MTETSDKAAETDSKSGLSIKRQRFCEKMLVCSSATKAAIAVGYSEKSAHVTACRLLKDANVEAEITRLRKIAAEKADIKDVDVIYGIQHAIDVSFEQENMTAVMNGYKMLGQYRSMWKDVSEVKDMHSDSDHHRSFAALALEGADGDRVLARRIFRSFLRNIGSEEVFGPEFSDEDIDALLDGATQH